MCDWSMRLREHADGQGKVKKTRFSGQPLQTRGTSNMLETDVRHGTGKTISRFVLDRISDHEWQSLKLCQT
jgi:hypothetical protein